MTVVVLLVIRPRLRRIGDTMRNEAHLCAMPPVLLANSSELYRPVGAPPIPPNDGVGSAASRSGAALV